MAPSSLQRQCTNAAIRNLKRIDEYGLGEAPWRLLKPIVNKCEDPRMLRQWERHSEQIRGETGDIWLKFIKRDVPNWRNKPHEPSNPLSWHKVYFRLKKEADLEERRAEELLKQKMSKIKKDEDSWKVAPPTKAIPERQSRNKGVAMQFQRGSDNNGLRFTTGTKTKDFMQSVRRQAAESKLQKSGVLARPSNMLNNGTAARKIMQAPQHMVEDIQRQAGLERPQARRSPEQIARPAASPAMSLAARAAHDLKMREERLKAVREGRTPVASSTLPTPLDGKKRSTRPSVEHTPTTRITGSASTDSRSEDGGLSSYKRGDLSDSNRRKKISSPPSTHEATSSRFSGRTAGTMHELDELFGNDNVDFSTKRHRSDDIEANTQAKIDRTAKRSTSGNPTPLRAKISPQRPDKQGSSPVPCLRSTTIPSSLPAPPSSASTAAAGNLKRKVGPTILLPMKRKKK